MMNVIFRNLIVKEIIIVYLNNILIFTWILEDYLSYAKSTYLEIIFS